MNIEGCNISVHDIDDIYYDVPACLYDLFK